jgi:hypothetical protein
VSRYEADAMGGARAPASSLHLWVNMRKTQREQIQSAKPE